MAEQFRGHDHAVRSSNAGGELLLGAWIAAAERLMAAPAADGPDVREALGPLLGVLRERLSGHGDGGRAFDLHPLPAELSRPAARRALLRVIDASIAALGRCELEPAYREWSDLHADAEGRRYWLARLLDLREMASRSLPSDPAAAAPPPLALSAVEQARVEFLRLRDRRLEHERRARREGREPDRRLLLAWCDRLIALAASRETPEPATLSALLLDRADQLNALGDAGGELVALAAAAALEPDAAAPADGA